MRGAVQGAALLVVACGGPAPDLGPTEFAAPEGSVAPFLLADGHRVWLTWTEPVPDGHAVRLAVREDGTWATRGTIVLNDSLFVNWADFPSVAMLPGGQLLAHWLQKTAPATYAYHTLMRASADGGRTWTAPVSPHTDRSPTEHGFVSMVPWGEGIAAVWLDGRKMASGAHGDSGQAPMTLRFTTVSPSGAPAPDGEVDPRVCECCQTALVATPAGLVAAYRDRTDGEIRDIAISRLVHGAWTPARKVHDDGWHYPGCPVNGPALAARGDTVAVAWYTGANGTPRASVAFSFDAGATFGDRVVIDDGRPAGRVDVAWVGERAFVVWLEETAGGGEVRARGVTPAGRVGPSVAVAATSAARASGFPRLAVVADTVFAAWTATDGESRRVQVSRLTLR